MKHSSLRVDHSFMKARWELPDPNIDNVDLLMRQHDVPEIVARLLDVRGIDTDQVSAFLHPTLRDHFPDPLSMAGMDAAADDIARAIMDGQSFAIFGDFDVDGATSSAVLYRFLKACGLDVPVYIPERLTEGYGPNDSALQALRDQGAEILFMLDCGSSAVDTIAAGQDMGLKIVVLDHHEPSSPMPPAWHMINPKRADDQSGLDMLAAVGVIFLFCVAVNAKLRDFEFYNKNNIQEPVLKSLLDLVGLGTVCDLVPLQDVNRLFVRAGFACMDKLTNVGLKALANVSGVEPPFDPYHAGFIFGPRVNAGSRVGKSDLGATLFRIDDSVEAQNIAWTLNDCNDKRKAMQTEMEREAIQMVEDQGLADDPVIIVSREDWHSGLTGLVAGRLKEQFAKPVCVIALEDGVGKGSGRSIPGVHLGQIFLNGLDENIVIKGGGHAMAGGFTVAQDQMTRFCTFVKDQVVQQMAGQNSAVVTHIDSLTTVRGALNLNVVKQIHKQVGPFGQGFEEPLFLLHDVRVHSADIVGDAHIKLLIGDAEGGPRMKAMAFRAVGSDMGHAFLKEGQRRFHILGRLKVNAWQGRESVEMHIKDAAFADHKAEVAA